MTSSRTRVIASAFTALGICAALTGCAADSGEQGSSVDPSKQVPVLEEKPRPDKPLAAAGPDCLVGSWQLRNETFEAALTTMLQNDPAVPAEMLASLSISLSGQSALRFGKDGDYGAWQDEFTMIIGTGGEQTQHTQSSADVAQYEADGERVRVGGFQQLFVESELRVGDSVVVAYPTAMLRWRASASSAIPPTCRQTFANSSTALRDTVLPGVLKLHADGFPSAAEFIRVADITGG